jgi:pimeloyl-ACP methyl ester carboxylesterase
MHRALLGLFAAVIVLSVIGRGATATANAAPATAINASSLSWTNCQPRGFQCATLEVPVNYSDPNGATLSLALMRLPATSQSNKIGSLLANPGGPGGSALDFLTAWAGLLSNQIRSRFDLVAFDPRGVGKSTPIICHATLQKLVAVDPSPDNQAEWDAAEAASKRFADDCEAKYPSLLPFLGTKNVARDMESVRIALGEDKLTYVGYSYGTAIGAVYADMYPNRVRAFVLDGAVDLSLNFEDANKTQMIGFERAFNAYLDDCRQRKCSLTKNGDPGAAVDKLLAQVETQPLPAPSADRPAGPGEVLLGIISALYSSSEWNALTGALVNAINGDGSGMVELTDEYLQRNPDGSYPNLMEANAAVNFDDETCPKDPNAYIAMAARLKQAAPRFGESAASAGLLCAYWPTTPDPLTTPHAAGAPPIVLISTTNDPATPYESGVAMSKQLESGPLITHRGEGHTIYAQGDSCVDAAVNAYLINLTVPEAGKTCGNGPPPPDSPNSTGAATVTASPGAPASPTPTRTATPRATAQAPGAPNTGSTGDKDNGSTIILIIAGSLVILGLVVAGGVVYAQQRR